MRSVLGGDDAEVERQVAERVATAQAAAKAVAEQLGNETSAPVGQAHIASSLVPAERLLRRE